MSDRIPKRIVQIWGGGNELPLLYQAACTNVRLLNPSFEYLLFDDAKMADFLHTHFPQHVETFHAFALPIQRYDFFRYLAIYQLGGFYFDTDFLLAKGVDDLCRHRCVVPFERLTWSRYLRETLGMDWEIGNYAFGAEPKHPLIGRIIDNCARAQRDRAWGELPIRDLPSVLRSELHVIYSTGPGMFSRSFAEQVPRDDSVTVVGMEDRGDRQTWNRFGRYGIHLGGSSWRTRHNGIRRRLLNFLAHRNEKHAISLLRSLKATTEMNLARG